MGAREALRASAAVATQWFVLFLVVCALVVGQGALPVAAQTLTPTHPAINTAFGSLADDGWATAIIPLAAACKWAHPGKATGQTSGSGFSIVCLDKHGNSLGGFGGRHSLNAWCDDPRHTAGMYLPNPALVGDTWICDILSNIPGPLGGYSVAISGSTAVVGLPGLVNSAGAAYIYAGSKGRWHQAVTLADPAQTNNDQFGWSVATAAAPKGRYVVVGSGDSSGIRGSVYIYQGSGAKWHRQATLRDPAKNKPSTFGASVAISGSLLVISAVDLASNRGTVYIFRRSSSSWVLQAQLTSPVRRDNDFFGQSIAIADQHTVLIGGYDVAYVYSHPIGRRWMRTARLGNPSASADNFGWGVAASGRTAIVTAPGFLGSKDSAGAGLAYVYSRTGNRWSRVQTLKAPASNRDAFGASIAMTNQRIIVGAPLYSKVACGRAYEFRRTSGKWTLLDTLIDAGCQADAFFGFSVAISQVTALFGAPYSNGTSGVVFIQFPLP